MVRIASVEHWEHLELSLRMEGLVVELADVSN